MRKSLLPAALLALSAASGALAASITFPLGGAASSGQTSYTYTSAPFTLVVTGQRANGDANDQPTSNWVNGTLNRDANGVGVDQGSTGVNNSPDNGRQERLILEFTPNAKIQSITLFGLAADENVTIGTLPTGTGDSGSTVNLTTGPTGSVTFSPNLIPTSFGLNSGRFFVGAYYDATTPQTSFRLSGITVDAVPLPLPAAAAGALPLLALTAARRRRI